MKKLSPFFPLVCTCSGRNLLTSMVDKLKAIKNKEEPCRWSQFARNRICMKRKKCWQAISINSSSASLIVFPIHTAPIRHDIPLSPFIDPLLWFWYLPSLPFLSSSPLCVYTTQKFTFRGTVYARTDLQSQLSFAAQHTSHPIFWLVFLFDNMVRFKFQPLTFQILDQLLAKKTLAPFTKKDDDKLNWFLRYQKESSSFQMYVQKEG